MAVRHNSLFPWAGRLAICALALGACAPAPTAAPTHPATATALPPTAVPIAATVQSTPAGSGNIAVPAISVQLDPNGFAFDADGNLYVSNGGYSQGPRISKVDPFGLLTNYAGTGGNGFSGDGGAALSADFADAGGLAFDRDGNLYVADGLNNRIRRIDRKGIISTVAGSGPSFPDPGGFAGDGGPATAARLYSPTDVAFDADGNMYIADAGNNRIRKVDRQGIITTVAGNGTAGFSGDGGPATAANLNLELNNPNIALDADGNVYVTDGGNGRVREIDKQGIITTIAGSGGSDVSSDGGQATDTVLTHPTGLAFDAEGNLYVATLDVQGNHDSRVRRIDKHGIITTVAGTGALGDVGGDGGPATSANVSNPQGLAFDAEGNLYIADAGNGRVRKVDKKGIITTFAGGAP